MNTILFDLDSTLLPMDQKQFEKVYFTHLTQKLAQHGYDPEKAADAVWRGTYAMVKNDGTQTNETRFWNTFRGILGEQVNDMQPILDDFYSNEFHAAKSATGQNPLAKPLISSLKAKGFTVVLATNPLFPPVAVKSRLSWIDLTPNDFEWVTTYNNCRYTKPNLNYYKDILSQIGKKPEECLMVGNDMIEDACAAQLGLGFYLVTNHHLNIPTPKPEGFPHGTFEECFAYLSSLEPA